MGWGALLKAAVSLGGRAIKAVAKSAGGAVVHPQQTLKGLGSATKSAAIGGSLGYIGWEKLTTDKSVVGIVSDAVIGEETTQKIGDTVSNIGEGMKEVKDSVTGLTENVNDAITSADSKWNGMSKFLQGICSGNGGNMMGNFFSNIGKGNVSGLSLIGLVVAALLVFGRFGWMGKIAGAVLAMMMIGNNVNMNEALASEKKRPAAQSQDKIQQSEIAQGTGGGRRR